MAKRLETLSPRIRSKLPGPNAKRLIEQDQQVTSPSYTREYPLVVERARGAMIEDVDGNLFLDFTAGIAVCSTGHCHPDVVQAIHEQSSKLLHMSGTDFYYHPQIELAQRLAGLSPTAAPNRVFFTNSGTEAVEAAFKLARHHTGRKHVVAFYGAFHGRSMGALSLTASKVTQRRRFAPLVPLVSHVEYPNCYRCPARDDSTQCCFKTFDQLEQLIHRTVAAEEIAAIVVEPIQGEGGYIVPPDSFLEKLRQLCSDHGILLIADEVQSGMGRTGRMFAIEHWGVQPDIVCLAKGIASGLPLGAIVASEQIMNWPPGSHASTFGGNPVACVAALETIRLLEDSLITNAQTVGQHLLAGLRKLAGKHPAIGDVRGKGLMVGVELVQDPTTCEPDPERRDKVVQQCFEKGLLLLGCGENTLRFCPPLVITRQQAETAIQIVDQVLSQP